jgi:hypothetical protein
MTEPKQKLEAAANAVSTAVLLLRIERPTFEAFLKECAAMENFGSILDPTLYRNSERRAVSSLLEPMFAAALAFLNAYDAQLEAAASALKKVQGGL